MIIIIPPKQRATLAKQQREYEGDIFYHDTKLNNVKTLANMRQKLGIKATYVNVRDAVDV